MKLIDHSCLSDSVIPIPAACKDCNLSCNFSDNVLRGNNSLQYGHKSSCILFSAGSLISIIGICGRSWKTYRGGLGTLNEVGDEFNWLYLE